MTASFETLPSYDDPDLARRVETLPATALDELPFGAIHVDAEGRVTRYSRVEAEQSGMYQRPVLGRAFFQDIAPCMNGPAVRERIERARAAGTLDVRLRHVGDFADRGRTLEIRAMSAADGGFWLFNRRI
jgi:photoactive yellow protein